MAVSYKCFIFIFESKHIEMKTTQLTKEDILSVGYSLKMDISEEVVEMALEAYDDYQAQHPDDNWRLIVETMLYDYFNNLD